MRSIIIDDFIVQQNEEGSWDSIIRERYEDGTFFVIEELCLRGVDRSKAIAHATLQFIIDEGIEDEIEEYFGG